MGNQIHTVTGNIEPGMLGFCHSHEHLLIRDGVSAKVDPNLKIDEIECSLAELRDYYAIGGRAVVDAQPVGCGRMCEGLKELSQKSGVSVIASTGFHMRRFYPDKSRIFAMDREELQALFQKELLEGMYVGLDEECVDRQSNIKAGIIKCALDLPSRIHLYREALEAVARTANALKAPILVHVEKGADIQGFLLWLERRAVNPKQVILCHLDRAVCDLGIHKFAAAWGAWLEYDTIARYKYHGDEKELFIIKTMVDSGHEGQILLGLDTTRARLFHYGGTPGLSFILEKFMPMAEKQGISRKNFLKFMQENPSGALAFPV